MDVTSLAGTSSRGLFSAWLAPERPSSPTPVDDACEDTRPDFFLGALAEAHQRAAVAELECARLHALLEREREKRARTIHDARNALTVLLGVLGLVDDTATGRVQSLTEVGRSAARRIDRLFDAW